jgi:predicted metal-dependent phosphoesterase TrpH
MNEFRADLHCHSTCSDGTSTPIELIQIALEKGLQGLSITDHDTVHSYPIALPEAQKKGIRLISGIEFSATHKQQSVHILGYSFNLSHDAIRSLCKLHVERRKERNEQIVDKLKALGKPIDALFSEGVETIGRPHIAKAMIDKGYVENYQEAFKLYLGEDKPAYARGRSISIEETLAAIKSAGGVAIIAHPHLIQNGELLRELLTMPFDGMECYYANFMRDRCERWLKMAKKRNWLATGGSDFHGNVKPNLFLGSSWTPLETFEILYARFKQNNPC